MFTVAGLNQFADLLHEIVATLEAMGIQVEQMGKEYGASQFEFSVRYGAALAAADRHLITKEVTRALALRRGLIASYMPKPFTDSAGNGLHANLALWDENSGSNLLAGGGLENPLSETGRRFIGGLMAHAPGICGVGAPTVNSYKRLQPASWAPAHIAWGVGNRGVLLRVPDVNKRCRVEYRAGDNTCNPYFFLTALLAAGWDGMQTKADPGAPFNDDDVGHFGEAQSAAQGIQFLPRSLPVALGRPGRRRGVDVGPGAGRRARIPQGQAHGVADLRSDSASLGAADVPGGALMLDFSDLPVVDVHCHPYTRKDALSADEWVDALAFGGGSAAYLREGGIEVDDAALSMLQRLKRDTLYFRFMLRRLAEYFAVEATVDAVVAARNRAIKTDGYAAYAQKLHQAGKIETLIVDDGYPLPQIDLDSFRAEVGVEVAPLFRIEVLIQDLLDDGCGWSEFQRRYDDALAEAWAMGATRG